MGAKQALILIKRATGVRHEAGKAHPKGTDVDKAKPGDSVIEYRIEGVPGMTLRVEATPRMVDACDVLSRASGQKRRSGGAGGVAYDQAKSRALETMAVVERGGPLRRRQRPALQPHVQRSVGAAQGRQRGLGTVYASAMRHLLSRYALKDIGAMKADAVTDGHVRALLDNIRDGKGAIKINSFNSVLAAIGSTYAWATRGHEAQLLQ
jgi:hypothetical protein